jgi:ribosome-binding factor A
VSGIMATDRIKRVNELLRREIGESLFRVIKPSEADLSAITVTHVIVGRDLRTARVLVSIRDNDDQKEKILALLQRCRPQIQRNINRDLLLKYTPRLAFELDDSIAKGDAMLALLMKMEEESGIAGQHTPDETDETAGAGM